MFLVPVHGAILRQRYRQRFHLPHHRRDLRPRSSWEDAYRDRWQHDKIVRSTHGVNCTGSCSWKIYVKNGLVTWETQQTDYPRTRADLPNHEPRGCARGASYSWYIYSANRVKYPMIRGTLLELWRAARQSPEARSTPGPPSSGRPQARRTQLQAAARPGRLWCADLGRGQRDYRGGQCLHRQAARSGPRDRLFAHPGHVHGQLRRRLALPVADRRHLHELLRLVLRPAASQPADLGRADRRARIGRLVQLDLHHDVGLQRARRPARPMPTS
jgi:hypothetical protein